MTAAAAQTVIQRTRAADLRRAWRGVGWDTVVGYGCDAFRCPLATYWSRETAMRVTVRNDHDGRGPMLVVRVGDDALFLRGWRMRFARAVDGLGTARVTAGEALTVLTRAEAGDE